MIAAVVVDTWPHVVLVGIVSVCVTAVIITWIRG